MGGLGIKKRIADVIGFRLTSIPSPELTSEQIVDGIMKIIQKQSSDIRNSII